MDDRRERLELLRDQLETAIAGAADNMLPQLAGQYRATLTDIAALAPAVVVVSSLEAARAKREARKASPKKTG